MGIVEILGWLGALLVVGAYFLNVNGKVRSTSVPYLLCNLIGGLLLVIHTYVYRIYPGMVVSIFWMVIAVAALLKKDKRKNSHAK